MKPIINLEFSESLHLDECQKFYNEVRDALKDEECCIIGTFKPFMEIKEIFGDNIILKFNDKDYTVAEIIEALEIYKRKEKDKCQI